MDITRGGIRALYTVRAAHYDLALAAYRAVGFRASHYRRQAVTALRLGRGDTVVDLACGTGLNFPLLQRAVGPEGRIVGVDMTPAMLDGAGVRVRVAGWTNVTLVQADIADYAFPPGLDGIISTFAITLCAEYDTVIRTGARALRAGGRMAIADLKRPERWPGWLVRFGAWVYSPYGVSLDLADRRPWRSLREHLSEVSYREYYFGGVYVAVGQRAGGEAGLAAARG